MEYPPSFEVAILKIYLGLEELYIFMRRNSVKSLNLSADLSRCVYQALSHASLGSVNTPLHGHPSLTTLYTTYA